MKSRFISSAIFFAATLHAQSTPPAQAWFPAVPASSQSLDISVGLPTDATYKFAAPNCDGFVPVTVTAPTTISDYDDGQDGRPPDPCPGSAKELDVLQTSAQQTIIVSGQPVIVPALQAAPAAAWYLVARENPTLSVQLPAGTTYRFGTENCPAGTVVNGVALDVATPEWTVAAVNGATTIASVTMAGSNPFPFPDPCPGTVKQLDVLKTTAQQLIVTTDTATGNSVHLTISGLPPALTAGPHQVLLSDFHDDGGSTSALLLWAANQPASGATQTYGGTSFTLTIDGFPMTCSYGQTYASGVFSLSCTAQ